MKHVLRKTQVRMCQNDVRHPCSMLLFCISNSNDGDVGCGRRSRVMVIVVVVVVEKVV